MANPQRRQILTGGYRPSPASVDPTFRILKDLAEDLSKGTISFPTFINATLKIKRVLGDPQTTADRVARTISGEPMLAAKLVHVANSVAMSGSGKPVSDVKGAVLRVGYSNVHAIATSVAMGQLLVAKEMQPFLKRAEAVWLHSLDVAAIAYVLAAKLTKLNPDEALFAGLVHDIGRFYLLSKIPKYPELTEDLVALEAVIDEWHAQIGHGVLGAFGLTDSVLQAVADHETTLYPKSLKTLSDVIAIANLLSKTPNPLHRQQATSPQVDPTHFPEYVEILEASADELTGLVAALRS
jgi:putative nucleotidyltransferase with HDIG domain